MSPRIKTTPLTSSLPTARLQSVLSLCKKMNAEHNLPGLLDILAQEAGDLLSAQGASLLLLDQERCELWSYGALDGATIRIDARLGIAGAATLTGELINVSDAQQDSRFYPEIDMRTKKRTRTLLAVPLRGQTGEVLGVLEVMNKKTGTFDHIDEMTATVLAEQAAIAIETTQMVHALRQQQDQLLEENGQLWKEVEGRFVTQNLLGTSPLIQAIVRLIDQIRESSVDVLITGENGTGKELVAKAIHYNSPRAKRPFVALNCAALPDHLVESELFGIEKGVATGVEARIGKFEQANSGTLFLDEVGDLGLQAQAKILRVLQERTVDYVGGRTSHPVDVRVVAATNKELDSLIQQGAFRQDLYYRLKVVHIHTPSLREIPQDVPLLASYLLNKYCRDMQKEQKHLTANALRTLQAYPWPGNVRELENEMKRLAVTARRTTISEHDLDESIRSARNPSGIQSVTGRSTLHQSVAELEKKLIREALQRCQV